MEGRFLRKKFNSSLFLLFCCGLFLIGLYIFLNIVDPQGTDGILTVLIFGILVILTVIPSWLLNFGAFITVDEHSIKGKYHWFGKIDCKISDVTFVGAQIHTLNIVLNNGKTYTIMGVENCWQLASFIRRNMTYKTNETAEALIEKLNALKSRKKVEVICVIFCFLSLFVSIFVTLFLTGERDLAEFSQTDWVIFVVMGVVDIIIFILTFLFANKAGKNNIPIQKLQYDIQKRTIDTKDLLPGNVLKVFANEDYSLRVTVFGFPNDNFVYFTLEKTDSSYNLNKVYESEIFESFEMLNEMLDGLIDITERVIY